MSTYRKERCQGRAYIDVKKPRQRQLILCSSRAFLPVSDLKEVPNGYSSVAYIAVIAIALLTACADSSDSDPVPAAAAIPVVPFEQSLSSDDLAKFGSLPIEFRSALLEEALVASNDHALAYLHDLPDNAMPIAELLSTDVMERFGKLPKKYQR
jgi:hypothetical protein